MRISPRFGGAEAGVVPGSFESSAKRCSAVWVVVGDAATVRPQLEALGLPVEVRAAQ